MQEQKLLNRKRRAINEGNQNLLASTCIDLAELYEKKEQHSDAIEEYVIVADTYKQMGMQLDYARANRMIGEAYTHLRQYDKALKYQKIYLKIAQEQNDKVEEQRALAAIGQTYLTTYLDIIDNPDKSALTQAHEAFMKSLMICESLTGISKREHKDMIARLLANLGLVREGQGKFDEGINLLLKAVNLCEAHDLFEELEHSYRSLGSLHSRKGEYSAAISYYNLAMQAAGRLKDKVSLLCVSLTAKAELLIKLADFQGAKNVLLKANKLNNSCDNERDRIKNNLKVVAAMCKAEKSLLAVNNSDYVAKKKLYEKLGDGSCRLRSYDSAIVYYKKMLEAAENNGETGQALSPCYVSLAETYNDNGQFELAIEYFKKDYLVTTRNTKDSITTLLNLADCMEVAERSLGEIEKIYYQARSECIVAREKHLEYKALSRHVAVLRKYKANLSKIAQFEQELRELDVNSESESEPFDENGTPNIGDDISISEITDVSDDSDVENGTDQRGRRNRGTKSFIIKRNCKGETQLHTACITGNVALVKRLLDQGHPVNVRDNCGWLPIHEASICGRVDIIEMLIEKGASVNDRGGAECNGMTPLHDAAVNGHVEVMQLLLDNGASAIAKNDSGEMPLHILQKWQSSAKNLNCEYQHLYDIVQNRLKQDMEKSGHSADPVIPECTNAAITSDDVEVSTQRVRRSKDNMEKQPAVKSRKSFSSLRRNCSFDLDDLDATASQEKGEGPAVEDSESSDADLTSCNDIETNATNEYRRVMISLRHPQREEIIEKKRKSNETHVRSAYVDVDGVEDNWLENDMPNHNKKRKTSTIGSPNYSRLSRKHSNTSLKSKDSGNEHPEYLNEFFNLVDASEAVTESVNLRGGIRDSVSASLKKKKSQSSLIDQGFTRRRSFGSSSVSSSSTVPVQKKKIQTKLTTFPSDGSDMDIDLESVSNRSGCSNRFNEVVPIRVINSNPTWSIDVRIDGKLHRIPVPAAEIQTRTIKWLSDETVKRYSKKECIQPTIELQTKNGAVLAEDDFVSILFALDATQAEEVEARVLKWNLPSLFERYTETCTNLGLTPDEKVAKHLQESATAVNISNFGLRKDNVAPLFKAINRQINLHSLDLSGNVITKECFQLLCATFLSLDNLSILNLSSCQLTADTLEHFADMFVQASRSVLQSLISLNLSYNPLRDESLKYLAIITRYLQLQKFNLMSVDFTDNIFNAFSNRNVILCLDCVRDFNISYNRLGNEPLKFLLSWLKPHEVENLNISSNIGTKEGLVKIVTAWLENRDNGRLALKALNLSRCYATDSEIFELLRNLLMADQFTTLDLSYSNSLTALSLRRLMQHRLSLSNINLVGCQNIFKYFEDCTASTWSAMRLKSIKLTADCMKNAVAIDLLTGVWKEVYHEKAKIVQYQGFLELSVKV